MTKRDSLRRDLFLVRDNLVLSDVKVAVNEVMQFRNLGGGTIVDVTLPDIGRDPVALQTISRLTGVHVVMGCGHYVHLAHPPSLEHEPVEAIAERLITEIVEGVEETGIRPGIIGEIGTWRPIHRNEEKVLRAAARAQRDTGLALTVHLHFEARAGHEVLAILDEEDVDPSRVVLGHLDMGLGHPDADFPKVMEYHRSLAARGAFIAYDCCGSEPILDVTRARAIAWLFDNGIGDQLLISSDVFVKSQLVRYGGFGYGHILRDFQRLLREIGLDEAEVAKLLHNNAHRMLRPQR